MNECDRKHNSFFEFVCSSEEDSILPSKLGSIPLVTENSSSPCGAAFTLVSPASVDVLLSLASAEVELRQGQKDVVVRFKGAKDASEAFTKGHELTQQGLDLASILGHLDTVIRDAEADHVLWWTEPAGLIVRIVATVTQGVGVGPAKLEARDANGNIVPSGKIEPHHHIGFRYYRLAQTTDDLYDAYRNMYLAFEALLSSRFPKKKRGETEREWLVRGLSAASATVSLVDLVPSTELDPTAAVLKIIYGNARLPLFHAKEGEAAYAPHDSPANRKVVADALNILTRIVLRMAEAWFDARRMGGCVALGWFYGVTSKILEEASMLASDDPSPADQSEENLTHPRFKNALKFSMRLAPELQKGSAPAVLGCITDAELKAISALRRVDLVSSELPLLMLTMDAELTVEGIARLEVLLHSRANNLNQPKSLFRQ
jgi:hypothetical protein